MCPKGDARTSAEQPPGSRSLAFGEDEEKGKNLKDSLAGAAAQRCRCSSRARAPLPARLWTVRFGDSRRDLGTAKHRAWCPGLLKGTLTSSDPKKNKKIICLIW